MPYTLNEQDNKRTDSRTGESAGQEFVRKIKPIGAAMFLLMFVGVLIVCFTAGRDPIPGYSAPHDTAYYAENLGELQAELEASVFPVLETEAECFEENGVLVVVFPEENFAAPRSAVLRYFDESLFEFRKG